MTTKTTILHTIRKHCLECACGSVQEVELCTSENCALYLYRSEKDSKPNTSKTKKIHGNTLVNFLIIQLLGVRKSLQNQRTRQGWYLSMSKDFLSVFGLNLGSFYQGDIIEVQKRNTFIYHLFNFDKYNIVV